MSKQTSIDALNVHLFETIEMLKNNKDPVADEHEKIDIETAKTIADVAGKIIDGYKVKAQVLNIYAKADNPTAVNKSMQVEGFFDTETKLIGDK